MRKGWLKLKAKISDKEYFENPAINRSSIYEMNKSPAHYKYLTEHPQEPTQALEFGTAFHTSVLEPERFAKEYVVTEKIDKRTKEGKAYFDALMSSGKKILNADDYKTILGMQKSVFDNKYAMALLKGEKETAYFWDDEHTGIDCKCKVDCRTDLKSTSVIVDLKSCNNAETEAFMRECFKYGYDLQTAWYKTGVDLVEGKPHKFVFIAVEKTPPYVVNILEADEKFIQKGYDDMRLYLGMLKECRELNNWYGYTGKSGTPNVLELPSWLAKDYE